MKGKAVAKGRHATPPTPPPGQPWERLPIEPLSAFEKFCHYRDLGGSLRSHRKTAERFGVAKNRIDVLGRKWRWTERVAAFDDHLSRIAIAAHETEIVEMNRRQANLGQGMQALAARAVQNRLRKAQTAGETFDLPALDIARLGARGVQIERIARGEATEIHDELPPPDPNAPKEDGRELARRILRTPGALELALQLDRALEADAGPDGRAPGPEVPPPVD